MNTIHDNIRWLVAALLLFALPAVAQVRDTLDFSVSERTFETVTVDGEAFNLYSYPDCDHIDQTGAPMLPVKYILLSVPYNAKDITVTGAGSYTQGTAGRRIYPAPVPIPTDGSVTEDPALVIDSAIYMANAYWPAHPAELVGEGFLMGENHIVTVAVYPMLYNPVAARVRNYSRVRLTVSYTLGGTPANMLVRYDPELRQQERQEAMALVDNPSQVEAHAVPASAVQHMMQQNPDTASWPVPGYEYMVVTTRELAPAFKRLIALKQQKGYRAGVVCVEDIVNDPLVQEGDSCILADGTPGFINDDAGKIRQYLKESHAYGCQYVLFSGDATNGMPFRYTNGSTGKLDVVPSDVYYVNLSAKWTPCNDTVVTYNNTSIPYLPTIYVGRILPRNRCDVINYSGKVLGYELNPGDGNTSYLKSALHTQCFEMQEYNQARTAAKQMISIFPDTTIFEEWNNDYPKGTDFINLIDSHPYGYINLHTHACPGAFMINALPIDHNTDNWGHPFKPYGVLALSQYLGYASNDAGNKLDLLSNNRYQNIVYSLSCTSMPFDYPDGSYQSYNVGSTFTLFNNIGCVAFLGNTRYGRLDFSFNIEKNFQYQILRGHYKLGHAEALSKMATSNRHCRLAHNLMGDPELELWTDEPQNYSHVSVCRGNNSICLTGLDTGSKTFIGMSDGLVQKIESATISNITITGVNPNSTVMVYQHNYLPYIAPLYLQNERVERSQYVIANDVYAGRNVDTNRIAGDLTIAEGSEYEIETKGHVVLAPGFKVEKGALFSVIQSDY